MIGKDGSEWIEISLDKIHVITGTETMGRFGNGQGAEFAENYMLEYFRPRLNKWVRYRSIENTEVMEGNTNTYIAVKQDLNPVVLASKVRFHPYSPHQRTICMRVEVYGCPYDGKWGPTHLLSSSATIMEFSFNNEFDSRISDRRKI